jgi:uncharacterized protein YlxW (UPF0749 family)
MEDLFASQRRTLGDRLEALEVKITKVLKQNRALQSENATLQEERRQLRQTIDRQREDSLAMQKQIKSSVIAVSMATATDEISGLREKIDTYVAEIERCIAHLEE